MKLERWLIYSLEHRAWWRSNSMGYTQKRREAGRYSLKEATNICLAANCCSPDKPMEAMIPEKEREE